MQNTFLAVFIAMVVIMMSGCARQQKLIKIPRTQENLQAFRECQRTVAVATGYDRSGIERLKYQCLDTLESSFEIVTTTNEPIAPPGCQEVEVITDNNEPYTSYYYLCK
jgi:hypothetical protein